MRDISFLRRDFEVRVIRSVDFVATVERNKELYDAEACITNLMIDDLYELAFLKIFGSWESFLEEAFKRLLCGYARLGVQETLIAGQNYSPSISDAERRMLDGKKYVSWYVPQDIVGRCRKFFPSSNMEAVIASASSMLGDQSATRHQIAHVQSHATAQFDLLTMRLTGKRFGRSRPGKFLRYVEPALGRKWFEQFTIQLRGLAMQIAG